MDKEFLKGSLSPKNIFRWIGYKQRFRRDHPDYFEPSGTLIFCGAQGYGKTLSAVQYVVKLANAYPKSILVTNVSIDPSAFPVGYDVREYNGLDDLKDICNGEYGVIYLIDEIHLELNSLESKNIDVDIMVEISQQRKQRKHIVGTSQIYGRMAKPLREQIRDVVLCKNYFGFLQFNKLINAFESTEENGKLDADVKARVFWLHNPDLYSLYDTYQKMKRYNKEWNGRSRKEVLE